jgi:hypothetical protein
MPAIVTVNVTTTQAPTPSTLQQTGAIISQGATNTTPGTYTLLTQASSLTPVLKGALAYTSLTQASGTATFTAATPHGYTVGDTLYVLISGVSTATGYAAYNGLQIVTVTTTTAFTYTVPGGTSTPAVAATGATIQYTDGDVAELYQMVTSFFGQGANTAVYVLELGPGDATDGATFLTTWIVNNPGIFYSYLVPREWDNNTTFLSLIASYEGLAAKTYFWVTTTLSTYKQYTTLMKDVFMLVETPNTGTWQANAFTALTSSSLVATATTTTAHGVAVGQWFQVSGCVPVGYNGYWQAATGTTGSTIVWNLLATQGSETTLGTLVANQYASAGIGINEFSLAAPFAVSLAINTAALVPPFPYTFLYGVTPFPVPGNSALLTTLAAANVNLVGTGAEGGISTACLFYGSTADGNQFNYWYAIDWANITLNLNVSNAVINGSNTTVSPLYLSQAGINTLQSVCAGTMSTGISAGLVFGSIIQTELTASAFAANVALGIYNGYCAINAVPFPNYYILNPGDYKIGKYGGFAVTFAPQLGFENITINLNATQFVG